MLGSLFRKIARSDCSGSTGSSSSSNTRKKTKNSSAKGDTTNQKEELESGSVSLPQCASSPPLSGDQEDETQQQQQTQFEHDAGNLQGGQQHRQDEEDDPERRETEHRNRLLEGQKNREQKASARNQYTKQQRVRYYHKISDQWIGEAVIVGVHYDDGPDKPYYTIKYNRPEDGSTMEKQTTDDRLEEVEFDEQKTWAILDATKK